MNLSKIICDKLGVKIKEEWIGNDWYFYRILENGVIESSNGKNDKWEKLLNYEKILNGSVKPIWKPVHGKTYYRVSFDYKDNYYAFKWDEGLKPQERAFLNGLVYRTREEAIEVANKMLEVSKSYRLNSSEGVRK